MRTTTRLAALVLCASLGLNPASAQDLPDNLDLENETTGWSKGILPPGENLLANPTFDDDLTGWHPSNGSQQTKWASENHQEGGSGSPGSVRLTNLQPNTGAFVFADCVPVSPGDRLVFGAAIAALGGVGGNGRVSLRFYSSAACSSSAGSFTPDFRTYLPTSTWGAAQGTVEVPAGIFYVSLNLSVLAGSTPPEAVYFDNAFLLQGASCQSTANTLCLVGDRFRVSATWQKPDGTQGWAGVDKLTADSGVLWFFKPTNIEMVVKVLDACSFSPNYWVFAAGLTNVEVNVEVFDTWTGEIWNHTNPLGQAFLPVQDTVAFATCSPGP